MKWCYQASHNSLFRELSQPVKLVSLLPFEAARDREPRRLFPGQHWRQTLRKRATNYKHRHPVHGLMQAAPPARTCFVCKPNMVWIGKVGEHYAAQIPNRRRPNALG